MTITAKEHAIKGGKALIVLMLLYNTFPHEFKEAMRTLINMVQPTSSENVGDVRDSKTEISTDSDTDLSDTSMAVADAEPSSTASTHGSVTPGSDTSTPMTLSERLERTLLDEVKRCDAADTIQCKKQVLRLYSTILDFLPQGGEPHRVISDRLDRLRDALKSSESGN